MGKAPATNSAMPVIAGSTASVRMASMSVQRPPTHSGEQKTVMQPIVNALLASACSAISAPKDRLIVPRVVIDHLESRIVQETPDDTRVVRGWRPAFDISTKLSEISQRGISP